MGKESYEVIREAPLNNNCPECFNQDLTLRFSQRHVRSKFYNRTCAEVRQELQCNTCKNTIYPVRYTADIERSVAYYEKAVAPARPSIRFSPLFYVLVLLGVALVAALAYAFLSGLIRV
jgi:hypothetical protein